MAGLVPEGLVAGAALAAEVGGAPEAAAFLEAVGEGDAGAVISGMTTDATIGAVENIATRALEGAKRLGREAIGGVVGAGAAEVIDRLRRGHDPVHVMNSPPVTTALDPPHRAVKRRRLDSGSVIQGVGTVFDTPPRRARRLPRSSSMVRGRKMIPSGRRGGRPLEPDHPLDFAYNHYKGHPIWRGLNGMDDDDVMTALDRLHYLKQWYKGFTPVTRRSSRRRLRHHNRYRRRRRMSRFRRY